MTDTFTLSILLFYQAPLICLIICTYVLSVSCGYALYGENGLTDIPDIMDLADQRMYEAKERKKRERAVS